MTTEELGEHRGDDQVGTRFGLFVLADTRAEGGLEILHEIGAQVAEQAAVSAFQQHAQAITSRMRVAVELPVETFGELLFRERRRHFLPRGRGFGGGNQRRRDVGARRRRGKFVGDVGDDQREPEGRGDDGERAEKRTELEAEERHEEEAKERDGVVI